MTRRCPDCGLTPSQAADCYRVGDECGYNRDLAADPRCDIVFACDPDESCGAADGGPVA